MKAPAEGDEGPVVGDEEDQTPAEGLNQIWAGTLDSDPTPEEAADFWAWLQESEPAIWSALQDVALGAAAADPALIEHGADELSEADQLTAADYPELTPEDRELLVEAVTARVEALEEPAPDSPEWVTAIAGAVYEVRGAGGKELEEEEEEEALEEPEDGADEEPAA